MKKFLLKLISLSLPVLLILAGVNYFGDGAKLFDNDYEKDIAAIIEQGKYVTNIKNYDERLLQKQLIKARKVCPNVMVTGSSRTMLINSELVKDSSMVNNSVSGASIEDIVSIYQMYKEEGLLPAKVIIGVDPWTFNENNEQERWHSIANSYYRFHNLNKDYPTNSKLDKLKQLFSFTYFQSSVTSLPKIVLGTNEPRATTNKFNATNTRLTDGSLIYGEQMRDLSNEKVQDIVRESLLDDLYGLKNFDAVSTTIWNEFVKLVEDMQSHGIEVEFLLAPYHPQVYTKIKEDYPQVLKAEAMVKNFADKTNITIYGSFNPKKAGLTENYFYDGMHCKQEGIKLILTQ